MRLVKVLIAGALLVASAPVAADADRQAPARGSRPPMTRAEHLAQRAGLLRGLPLAEGLADVGTRDRAALTWDEAYLVPVGDLDGVKGDDLVDVRYRITIDDTTGWSETVTLDARNGATGKQIWTQTLPAAAYVAVLFTKVGAEAKPGVLTLAYTWLDGDTDVVNAGGLNLAATAYAGGTGVPLWAATMPGTFGETPATYSAVGDTVATGVFQASPGNADDVLLTTATDSEFAAAGYSGAVVQASVLDGATGAVRPVGAPAYYPDWMWSYEPAGDLDKDGFDDLVAVSRQATGMSLAGISSVTGTTVWSNVTIPEGHGWWDVGIPGDATGDGVPDLAVVVPGPGSRYGMPTMPGGRRVAAAAKPAGPAVVMVNGATGKTLWSKRATEARIVGDVDRKKGAELLIVETLYGSRSGFVAGVYTGTGKRVWTASRTLKTAASPYAGSRLPWTLTGDVHGDGVRDLSYSIMSLNRNGDVAAREAGIVNGRTGKITRDKWNEYLLPTSTAIDGKGADAFRAWIGPRTTTIEAYSGDTRRPIWNVQFGIGGGLWRSTGGLLDGDKCGELVVSLMNGDDTFVDVALAGKSGMPLWALSRTGNTAAKVTKPSPQWLVPYRRTC